jgi:hypothetical protein
MPKQEVFHIRRVLDYYAVGPGQLDYQLRHSLSDGFRVIRPGLALAIETDPTEKCAIDFDRPGVQDPRDLREAGARYSGRGGPPVWLPREVRAVLEAVDRLQEGAPGASTAIIKAMAALPADVWPRR